MSDIRLRIDDREATTAEGSTLLHVCQDLGIDIPTLCYHKALPGYGACRLCLVEVERGNGATTVEASCVFPASEGLVVRTDTERVLKARRIMAELLLARCPDSDKVKEVARQVGVSETRFPQKNEDCILCGLCTRVCSMLMHSGAIDFRGRGHTREVTPAYDKHSPICMACGACAVVCPTGAVDLAKVSARPVRPVGADYDAGLVARSSIYIPYQQAIPKVPVIDRSTCMHFLKPAEVDACRACESACPAGAIDYTQEDEMVDLQVGAVVLAPGFCLYDAAEKLEMGYAWSPDVVTSLQFERILSASGPYEGQVLRPSNGEHAKQIAFLQCIGSRDEDHDYCSSVCCMYATKEAIIAMEHQPGLECSIFFMDLRAFGKGFDAYYERAKELGVRFVRCRPSSVEQIEGSDDLRVKYVDEEGHTASADFDLVVLSVGLKPPEEAKELADKFGIELDGYGFASTKAISPVVTSRDGVYVCGPFSEPKDIPETVTDASGAAAQAMSLLAEGRHTLVTQKVYPPEKDITGQRPRIGVFVCHCGRNIGGVVNVPETAEFAQSLPDVVYAEHNLYTCSSDTQVKIRELIKEHDLNRVIVASCTPRTHEPLFRDTVREAGLNPYLFEMANIRDQCSWVHMHEPATATEKAKDLVKMAVAKARLLEPLYITPVPVTSVALVIGGGVAGISAALNMADQGFPVHLVERAPELGGNMRHIHYLLNEEEDPQSELEKLVSRIEAHPNVTVWLGSNVARVDGFVGNFASTILRDDEENVVEHGIIIVATGATEYVPTEYLYGSDERVITQRQLEERLASGELGAKRVVMVQCVGSREDGRMYCSRVCCSQAIKNALKIKAEHPGTEVFVLYRDVRAYGFREKYYTEARRQGVRFVRYEPENKPSITADPERLRVEAFDPILQTTLAIDADLVVLAPAVVPHEDAADVAQMLKVPLTSEGFFLEAHMKLRPVDFSADGVFLAGLAHAPKGIDESIAQAQATAARAATILSKDEYTPEAIIACVDEEICAGCGLCASVCSYDAPEIVTVRGRRVSRINQALCKGCGACASACPSGAIQQLGFRPKQIAEMVSAALEWE